jgi:hypothetical protein
VAHKAEPRRHVADAPDRFSGRRAIDAYNSNATALAFRCGQDVARNGLRIIIGGAAGGNPIRRHSSGEHHPRQCKNESAHDAPRIGDPAPDHWKNSDRMAARCCVFSQQANRTAVRSS